MIIKFLSSNRKIWNDQLAAGQEKTEDGGTSSTGCYFFFFSSSFEFFLVDYHGELRFVFAIAQFFLQVKLLVV